MSLISKPKTFTAGTTIVSADVNSDFDTIYNDYNGNVTNANLASNAGVVDTKLATISTAGKVSGAALTGTLVFTKGSDVASATSTPIGAATGNVIDVTGTTTITSFDTIASGALRFVRFTGALTLTYNATSLILPTSANIVTAAGDTALFESLGSGNWVCLVYQPRSGALLTAGNVVQVVNTETGAVATGSTSVPYDDTIPQITEGDEYMTLAITPKSTSNKLQIDVVVTGASSSGQNIGVALFQDATAGALACSVNVPTGTGVPTNIKFTHYMTAGTTSATTFRVRAGGDSGTFTFNGVGGARKYGGVLASSITITEVKA